MSRFFRPRPYPGDNAFERDVSYFKEFKSAISDHTLVHSKLLLRQRPIRWTQAAYKVYQAREQAFARRRQLLLAYALPNVYGCCAGYIDPWGRIPGDLCKCQWHGGWAWHIDESTN
jgi:hypothetical protein